MADTLTGTNVVTSHHETLLLAIADAVDRGRRIPCGGSDAWVSDDARERAAAALECHACPCRRECGEAGESTSERYGVWGGPRPHLQTRTTEEGGGVTRARDAVHRPGCSGR